MAANMNKVFLAGNLTRDPEVRYTQSGTAVGQFGLAINRRFKGKDGQDQEDTTFVDVEVWGRTAENCRDHLRKGSPVLIDGRLKSESWDDKETGKKRSKLIVVAEFVHFIGSKPAASEPPPFPGDHDRRDAKPAQRRRVDESQFSPPASKGGGSDPDGGEDDGIPFRFPNDNNRMEA